MLKKYLPFIAVLLAATLLWYVKSYQRGQQPNINTPEKITVPVATDLPFQRDPGQLHFSKHARCRMDCRKIDESEVKEILEEGSLNQSKIQTDDRGTTYPLEGVTHDRQHVRIVFAPKDNGKIEVVTCIDLDTEWPCDCK